MKRVIDMARAMKGEETRKDMQELQALRPMMEGLSPDQIDPQIKARAMELTTSLMLSDYSPLGVIVAPVLENMDDYEDLLHMLDANEVIQLQEAVQSMATVRPSREVDPTALDIGQCLGLVQIPPDMLDNLTVSQANFFVDRINAERKAIEAMQRGTK